MGLKEQLAGKLPAEVLPALSDHFDVVGDIAILTLPAELELYKHTIAGAIVSGRKNILTVLNRAGKIRGDSRIPQYEILLGDTTITVHREFGFSYRLDVSSSFFSVRMAYERKRVADQVEPGEKVYVPFAGVGPYAIPAAARGAEVWAVEKNPDAFRWLVENAGLNHVKKNCHLREGDALDISEIPHATFDRLIIPAPYGMDQVFRTFLPLLSYGGMAHMYTFNTKEEVPGLIAAFESLGLTITFYSACGNVAPGVSRWIFDLALPL